MTNDLVTRLRDPDYRLANGNDFEAVLRAMMEDAADRIEHLEYALRAIAEAPVTWEIPSRTTVWGLAVQMRETAKDALKEGKHEERSTQL